MIGWILAGSMVLSAMTITVLAVARRRRTGPRHNLADDLFEGLLPSAPTGHPDRPPESDSWSLRWADAVTLTGRAGEPARSHPGERPAARAKTSPGS